MKRASWAGLCLAGLAATSAGWAESANMRGFFPAPNRQASYLVNMAVDRISGRDGPALEAAIEQRLANGGHFTMISGSRWDGGSPDGVISGAVSTGVEEYKVKLDREICVEKDGDGKCTRKESKPQDCKRRVVNLSADLRIVRRSDGAIVYSASKPQRDEVSWCPQDDAPRTVEEVVRGMIAAVAGQLADEITPGTRNYSIRFRETRKGMAKPLDQRFHTALSLTKRDLAGACSEWAGIDAELPDHPSVVFDLALCAEARGDYQAAGGLYRRASQLIGGRDNEGDAGADRIDQLIAGQEDARRIGRR